MTTDCLSLVRASDAEASATNFSFTVKSITIRVVCVVSVVQCLV